MRLPITGIIGSVSAALGLWGLYWYHSLSKSEQAEADQAASELAMNLYSKGLHELTAHQMKWVNETIKGQFLS